MITPEYDNFENEKSRIDKFNFVCFTAKKNSKDPFYKAIVLGISQKLKLKFKTDLNKDEFIQNKTLEKLRKIKENLRLNLCLKTFEDQCYDVNEILMEENLFLRVYKKRTKFRYLIRKPLTGRNSVIRDLSSCVIQRYNGYQVLKIEQKNCSQKDFRSIDIVYDPVETPDKIIECYFIEKAHISYRLKYSKGAKGTETLHVFECYSCDKFNSTKSNFEKH